MERIPIIWAEENWSTGEQIPADGDTGHGGGTAFLDWQSLYGVIRVRVPVRPGLWCAWAVGEAGEERVGVLEPNGPELGITRRLSRRALAPLGNILRVELRPNRSDPWNPARDLHFKDPWIQQQIEEILKTQSVREILERGSPLRREIALVRRDDAPFPLPGLFCFARSREIHGEMYWVFQFDSRDWPICS